MEKAYQDGYEPEVVEKCVCDSSVDVNGKNEVNTITASLDQGDQNTAPFYISELSEDVQKNGRKNQ